MASRTVAHTKALAAITRSRKRKCFIHVVRAGETCHTPSYWDGGSRDEWRVIRRAGTTEHVPTNHPFFNWRGMTDHVVVQHGDLLIKTGTFCGKPATPAIYCTLATVVARCAEWGLPELAAELRSGMIEDELVQLDRELERVQ